MAASISKNLTEMVQAAGDVLLRYFGKIKNVRRKENPSSVVCEADLAAEDCIVRRIRARFPGDSIIAEESGYSRGTTDRTWIIDPLDGTSNFVAGIPWFGAQVAVLRGSAVIASAMYLPVEKTLYHAEAGRGVRRNGKRLRVTAETDAKNVLCAFGLDPSANPRRSRQNVEWLRRVLQGVRNTRTTNSLVDFCYTLEGRFGGCINLNTKIWDIAPAALMLPEAGGMLTDLAGNELVFDLGKTAPQRSYLVLGASRTLHPQFISLLRAWRKITFAN